MAALFVCGACAAQPASVPRPDVKVGDLWAYQRMDYDANRPHGKYTMRVVFADVPAGKFRALKIVSDGAFRGTDRHGTSRNVIWYVPQVRRWVKMTLENRPAGQRGKGEYSGEELLSYKLQ